jgi:hypothetical protein
MPEPINFDFDDELNLKIGGKTYRLSMDFSSVLHTRIQRWFASQNADDARRSRGRADGHRPGREGAQGRPRGCVRLQADAAKAPARFFISRAVSEFGGDADDVALSALRLSRWFGGSVTYAELMSSRHLFALAVRVKADEEQAIRDAQEEQASAQWFDAARDSEGVNV